MVLAAKPTIEDTASTLEPALLGTLFANLGMLASVYQKPPEAFASRVRPEVLQVDSVDAPRAVGSVIQIRVHDDEPAAGGAAGRLCGRGACSGFRSADLLIT